MRPRRSGVGGLLFLALAALAAPAARASVQPEKQWGLPRDASVDGHLIDWLFHVTLLFVAILFLIMCVWMVWACVAHGRKHEAHYEHGDARSHVAVALAISALIFLVVDGNLFYNSVVDLRDAFWNWSYAEGHPKAVRIEVNAHQWAWDARYAGPDGKFNTADDIVTLNDLRIPAETPVIVELASTDVIHSFYLPNFRVKTDAVPGQVNRLWFRAKPDALGEYDIGCAQHCGVHHYKMKGKLTVVSMADYETWARNASALSQRAWDESDTDAHWGWEWRRN